MYFLSRTFQFWLVFSTPVGVKNKLSANTVVVKYSSKNPLLAGLKTDTGSLVNSALVTEKLCSPLFELLNF